MSQLKAMKFRVNSPEVSEQLQKLLFEGGYEWPIRGKKVLYMDMTFLYTDKNGEISYDFSNGEDNFIRKPYTEVPLDLLEILFNKPKQKTVKIGDKEYYEEELAEALSKIKPVEE